MKPRNRKKHKGRSEIGRFLALPHTVIMSAAFVGLSAHAVKLLIDMGAQYRGGNNGDLTAAWRTMQARGWRSRDTLSRALKELREAGFIELTRQGGLPRCSLYALTWKEIDECNGKLEIAATRVPSVLWMKNVSPEKQNASTPAVSIQHGSRVGEGELTPETQPD